MDLGPGFAIQAAIILFLFLHPAGLIPGCWAAGSSVQLSYGDQVPEDGLWVDGSRGHAVVFTPPGQNWTLDKVDICGRLTGGPQSAFLLEVWDKNLRTLYSANYSCQSYFGQNLSWAEIDIPDLNVSDDFLVCVFEFTNIYLGVDLSSRHSSGRSILVSRAPNRMAEWNLRYPQTGTEWLISATGLSGSLPPSVELSMQKLNDGVGVLVNASDPDGDLADATLFVVNAGSRRVVWSEHHKIMGREGDLNFLWPGLHYRVTNGTAAFEPLLVVRAETPSPESRSESATDLTANFSSSTQSLLAYTAPCVVLVSERGEPQSALAFFGEDGAFHALTDMSADLLYQSAELLKLTSPTTPYGRYSKENLTLKVDESTLVFYSMSLDEGMVAGEPLLLTRSPIQHYALKMERVPAEADDFEFIAEVVDKGGNRVQRSANSFPSS